VNAVKAAAQPAVLRRSEIQAAIVELHASLDEELVALRASRVEKCAALAPELLKRYEAASRARAPPELPRSSRAVVTAVASRCRRSISIDGRGSRREPS